MRVKFTTICLCIVLVAASTALQSRDAQPNVWPAVFPAESAVSDASPASVKLGSDFFIENVGQVDNGEILYYAMSGRIALAADSVYLYLPNSSTSAVEPVDILPEPGEFPTHCQQKQMLKLTFPGSNAVRPDGWLPLSWKSNYIRGPDRSEWRTGVGSYGGVIYRNLWDGIDLTYRLDGPSLKYEFTVHPFADPARIRVKAEGQAGMALNGGQELQIEIGGGNCITDSGLDVFYAGSESEKIAAEFLLLGGGEYTFGMNGRNPARTMVIDPLIYSTFLGGGGFDRITDVAIGIDGCAYVTGYTDSADFPTTLDAYENAFNDYTDDIFIAKMSLNGDSLVYSTFIGDVANDYSQAIAVDSGGNAYVAGYTSSQNFPTTPGAYDRSYNGDSYDAFALKISPFGDSLVYSTYLGGSATEWGYGIAVDSQGFAYVTGDTWSANYPITPGAAIAAFNGGIWGMNDIFITKLSQLGNSLVYSTFLGYNDYEDCGDIAVDSNGYAYVTGRTRSTSFPVSRHAYDGTHNGGYDAFVTKLSQTGTTMIFSTFLGGSGYDSGQGIAVGPWGHIYVIGCTNSPNFPTTPDAYDETPNGGYDVFVTMLDKYGEALGYSTYIGGTGNDYACGLAVDGTGCAYVAGYTDSADYPVTPNAYDGTFNGGIDTFMSEFYGTVLHRSSFVGGASDDFGRAVAVGPGGYAYIAGDTFSADYPITGGALDRFFNGKCDGFVTKTDIAAPIPDAGPGIRILEGQFALFDGGGSTDNHGIVNYTWSISYATENITLYGVTQQCQFLIPGIYPVVLNVSDASGNWATGAALLTVVDITNPVALAGPDKLVNEDILVNFNGTSSSDNVGITNFTWSFKESGRSKYLFGPSPNHTFATPGIYAVSLEVYDAAGNSATDIIQVQVIDITAPVAKAGPDRAVYRGTAVTIDGGDSKDNVEIVNYTWQFSDGVTDILFCGVKITHVFDVPGIYQFTLAVADAAGLRGTDTLILTVLETEKPVAVAGTDIIANEAESTAFDGSGCTDNVGVTKWVWSFNDGLNYVTLFGEHPTWIFTVPGVIHVSLNVSDAAGNWDTDTLTVTVQDALPPKAHAGPNHVIMSGSDAVFDGTGSFDSSGIAKYSWTFTYNGSAITLEGPVQSFKFWTPGTYTVTLTAEDAAGNRGLSQLTVTVYTAASAENGMWHDVYGWFLVMAGSVLIPIAAVILFKRLRGAARP